MKRTQPLTSNSQQPQQPGVKREQSLSRQRFWEWWVLLVVVIALVAAYVFVPSFQSGALEGFAALRSGDVEHIRAWAASFGAWGPLALLTLQLVQTVLAVIPALPLMIVSVLAYGPLWGGLLAWSGLLLACSFGYWIGRTFGAVAVDRFVSPDVAASVTAFMDRYGLWAVIVARLSPLFPADAISFVAGVTRFGFSRYLLASGIGILPVSLLLAFLGADVKRLMGGLVAVSLVTLVVFTVYVIRDRRAAHAARSAETTKR